jgi:hypothetical protein
MKNVFKTMALTLLIAVSSCSSDSKSSSPSGGGSSTSFVKAKVGDVTYDSTVNGQATATKTNIPFVGDQISIVSTLNVGPKTLNLTFIGVTGTGTFDSGAVVFYSPNGTSESSIGNDDSCDGVSATLVVTKYQSNLIEGTFTAQLKKSDCSGAVTPVTNGSFKATF